MINLITLLSVLVWCLLGLYFHMSVFHAVAPRKKWILFIVSGPVVWILSPIIYSASKLSNWLEKD